jgi:hypothetical protein
MHIRRWLAWALQAIVITALIVACSTFALGLFGFADATTVTQVSLTAATVGAISVIGHLLVSGRQLKGHL